MPTPLCLETDIPGPLRPHALALYEGLRAQEELAGLSDAQVAAMVCNPNFRAILTMFAEARKARQREG